jgi:2-dehydro-3-deoxyphosphogluconate aldolase/(4S)-4-hydroxy-2-oxoglutarate aldolase
MNVLVEALARDRVLPVLRTASTAEAHEHATRLAEARLGAIEITTTIPEWERLVGELRTPGGPLVGVGTVRTRAHAEAAIAAGADFLVSPHPVPGARGLGVEFVEGGFSPGEVLDAASRGPAKLFPAHVGGIAYLRDLLALEPNALIVPTGGLAVADAGAWVAEARTS